MSNKLFDVYLVEKTPPGRRFLLGISKGDNESQAIDGVKKRHAPIVNRLECGPNAYTFEAKPHGK